MGAKEPNISKASDYKHFYLRFWLDGVITEEIHVVVPSRDWNRCLHGKIDCYKCRSPRSVTRTEIATDENSSFSLEEDEFWRNVEWEAADGDART